MSRNYLRPLSVLLFGARYFCHYQCRPNKCTRPLLKHRSTAVVLLVLILTMSRNRFLFVSVSCFTISSPSLVTRTSLRGNQLRPELFIYLRAHTMGLRMREVLRSQSQPGNTAAHIPGKKVLHILWAGLGGLACIVAGSSWGGRRRRKYKTLQGLLL
jgi:hypothetical protein